MEELCSRRNLIAAFLFFVAYLVVYGYAVLRFGFDSDEILDFQGEMTQMYVANGRWGNALYRWCMHGGAVPYAAGMAVGVYFALAYVLQTAIVRLHHTAGLIVFGAVSLGVTQFYYFQVYTHNADAIALGILSISASVYCLQGEVRERYRMLIGLLLLAFGIAMYQTLAALFVVLCFAACLGRAESGESGCFRRLCRDLLVVGGGGLVLYYACHYALVATGVAPSELVDFARRYHRRLALSWSFFPDFSLYEKVRYFGYIGKMIVMHCLGLKYQGEWLYGSSVIPVMILLYRYFRDRRSAGEFLWRGGLVLAVWVFPLIFALYFVDFLSPRMLLCQSAACACLWGLALRSVSLSFRTMVCVTGCCVLVVLKASYNVSSLAYAERRDHENRVSLFRNIYDSAVQAAGAAGMRQGEFQIVLVDSANDLGAPGAVPATLLVTRAHWYARTLNLPDLRGTAEGELTPELKDELLRCQPWPAPDCYVARPAVLYVRVAGRSVAHLKRRL